MALDRTVAPSIHDAVEFDFKLPAINQVALDNGIPLYWLNAGVQDVAQIDWVFPAGLWYEPRPAIAHAIAGLLKTGTTHRTAAEINEALEFYGAQLKVGASNDYATLTLYTLTKHIPALLPVVFEILTEATFPEKELEIYKRNSVQRLLVNLRQCEFVANQKIDAVLFGEHHPYGRYTRKDNIESLTREDIVAHYASAYKFDGMRIFLGGNIGDTEIAQLNKVFGGVKIGVYTEPQLDFAPPPVSEHKLKFENDPNAVQGAIRIGKLFPNRHHPDFTPMVVLNTLFGGYFGSRLMSNIREEKGFTYGIHSSLIPEIHGGSILIQTETGVGVVDAAIEEIYKEMELLTREAPDEDELLLVKNYLLGGLLGDLDGPFSILQRWKSFILNGFDESRFNSNINIYKTITPDDVLALARKYYKPEEFYQVVVV